MSKRKKGGLSGLLGVLFGSPLAKKRPPARVVQPKQVVQTQQSGAGANTSAQLVAELAEEKKRLEEQLRELCEGAQARERELGDENARLKQRLDEAWDLVNACVEELSWTSLAVVGWKGMDPKDQEKIRAVVDDFVNGKLGMGTIHEDLVEARRLIKEAVPEVRFVGFGLFYGEGRQTKPDPAYEQQPVGLTQLSNFEACHQFMLGLVDECTINGGFFPEIFSLVGTLATKLADATSKDDVINEARVEFEKLRRIKQVAERLASNWQMPPNELVEFATQMLESTKGNVDNATGCGLSLIEESLDDPTDKEAIYRFISGQTPVHVPRENQLPNNPDLISDAIATMLGYESFKEVRGQKRTAVSELASKYCRIRKRTQERLIEFVENSGIKPKKPTGGA